MDSLDKYGTLKAALLAMRYVKNKQFLKLHFEEIFLFLQQHPEKTDLRDQLITYVLGQSDMTVQELQELLNNIFSPILKREIMYSGNGFLAVAAREAAAKATAEAQVEADKVKRDILQGKTIGVMHGWHSGVALNVIAAIVDLPQNKVAQLIATFEKVKTQYSDKTTPNMPDLKKLSGLDDAELKVLLALLQQH